eukprot:12763907-Alexandrium_andersonii.AAC.1
MSFGNLTDPGVKPKETEKATSVGPFQVTPRGTNFAPLQQDPPEVPPRSSEELEAQAAPGTYFPASPEERPPSARE